MFGSGSVTNSAQLLQLRLTGPSAPAVGPFKTSCVDSMPEARVSRTPRSFFDPGWRCALAWLGRVRAGSSANAGSLSLSTFRPDIKQDYPPNLSILISGGKENNCDSLSNGE